MQRSKASDEKDDSKIKGVFVWIKDPDDHDKLLKLKEIAARHPGKKSMILVLGEDRKSSIRLPFTVASSDAHVKELKELLGEKQVAVR